MAPKLAYWCIRALGEPIRTLLAYAGVDYENFFYILGESAWKDEKFSLGLDYPNLPYYIDGDLKISESSAIIHHLARKHGLAGDSEIEKIRIEMAEGVMKDLTTNLIKLAFSQNFEEDKGAFDAGLDASLEKCTVMLRHGDYVSGSKISYGDFLLLEMLERYDDYSPGCLQKYPKLTSFVQRLNSEPKIAAYRKSEKFQTIKTRFYAKWCNFGNGKESY